MIKDDTVILPPILLLDLDTKAKLADLEHFLLQWDEWLNE